MGKPLRIPPETLHQQYSSSDPGVSAWVSANAGSGKTHVLTQRVIRLMLSGNAPDRILCLTFTKAAAANMKNRVFDTLSKWTMLNDDDLDHAIKNVSGMHPSPEQRGEARRLFARALDTPGGLKIQTIHAFCEGLLHQFPLEANVPGHFQTLQELGQSDLLAQAKAYVLSGHSDEGTAAAIFAELLETVSQDAIETGIEEIIAQRDRFKTWTEAGTEAALQRVASWFGLSPEDTPVSILDDGLQKLEVHRDKLREISDVAAASDKKTDRDRSNSINQFLNEINSEARFLALASATLTSQWEMRAQRTILTTTTKGHLPWAVDLLETCGETVLETRDKQNALQLVDLSRHLFHIAQAVLGRYEALKRAKGLIDFDDQVDKCANLLTRSEIRDWIRYRLDRGIDHLLVDEAQDTSPRQWEIINALTEDFHSGNSAAIKDRTVFVVGDEKQSIYSFQGAEPMEFARQEKHLRKSVEAAQKPYHPGKLSLSFRSTKDVLHAVDTVFSSQQNREGLLQKDEQPVHDAIRNNDPGEVQVWPLYGKEDFQEPEDWLAPVDQHGNSDPAVRLAERITSSIGDWVGKPLPGSDEPLKYGDVLVLVRKRDRFITALTRTMKDAGLQVAGADRIVLTEHIAVEDLLAIGQFTLLPADDLNLACVLKGVLFGIDEETLFELANKRQGTLFQEVVTVSEDADNALQEIAADILERLEKLQFMASQLDVFEFFAWVLGPFGGRKAFLARLGMESDDVLDAFVDETLSFTREGGIGLENFVASLKRAEPEVKREVELERDEVRILTVHASKGLEAKVVFLVDPCNAPWTESHRPKLMKVGDVENQGFVWVPSKDFHTIQTSKETARLAAAAEGEYRRLLYVGMTRAADRLIVCGYHGKKKPNFLHWHPMVFDTLGEQGTEIFDEQGELSTLVWNADRPRTNELQSMTEKVAQSHASPHDPVLPDWILTPARHEPPLPSPLTPAGAHALIDDEPPEMAKSFGMLARGSEFALQRGVVLHKLLETLPDIDVDRRAQTARRFLDKAGSDWTEEQKADALDSAKRVIENPEFSSFFSDNSRAEVSLSGKLETRSGTRIIVGKVDRLVVTKEKVLVLDYKTGAAVPVDVNASPMAYITQLALYREILGRIYPNKPVECALLWTHNPEIQRIPEALLDNAIVKIKNI